jgi:hypothetical protein
MDFRKATVRGGDIQTASGGLTTGVGIFPLMQRDAWSLVGPSLPGGEAQCTHIYRSEIPDQQLFIVAERKDSCRTAGKE